MRGTRIRIFGTAQVAAAVALLTLLAVVAWPVQALASAVDPDALLDVLLRDAGFRDAFAWGAAQAAAATALGGVLGVAGVFCWGHLDYPGRGAARALAAAPLAIPPLVLAVGFETLFASDTPASAALSAIGLNSAFVREGTGAVVLAHALSATAVVGWFASTAWDSVDAGQLDAARTLGAGRVRAARAVVWPAVRPAVLCGAGLAFFQALLSYGVVVVLAPGRETPEVLAVRLAQAGDPRAAAVALLTLASSGVALASMLSLRPRGTGRPRPLSRTRPRGLYWLWVAGVTAPSALVLAALVALLVRAVASDGVLTDSALRAVAAGAGGEATGRAALGSALSALPAAALAALWGGASGVAFARASRRGRARGPLVFLLVPVAFSPAAIAFGWLLAAPDVDPRVILPVAQAAGVSPLVAGMVASAGPRPDPQTVAAARTLGARTVRARLALRGPLWLAAATLGFLVSFSRSLVEAGAAAVSGVPGGTLPLRLIDLERQGLHGAAAALAAVLALVCVLAFALGGPIIVRLDRARR